MAGWDPSEFLAVMDRRGPLLRELADGARDKPALETALDVSRSTIDRGIRELEECALVERADGGYRRTLAGRLAIEEYDRVMGRVAGLSRGAELLSNLDASTELDASMLAGGRVVEADRASPHRPVEVLYDVVESARAVRGFSPAVHPEQVRTYRDRISEGGMVADLVLTDEVLERMASEYAEDFQGAFDEDRMRIWQADDDLPYSLTIAETPEQTCAAVMVYGDRGILGCVLNDDPAAVAWAERRFRRERDRGVRVA